MTTSPFMTMMPSCSIALHCCGQCSIYRILYHHPRQNPRDSQASSCRTVGGKGQAGGHMRGVCALRVLRACVCDMSSLAETSRAVGPFETNITFSGIHLFLRHSLGSAPGPGAPLLLAAFSLECRRLGLPPSRICVCAYVCGPHVSMRVRVCVCVGGGV